MAWLSASLGLQRPSSIFFTQRRTCGAAWEASEQPSCVLRAARPRVATCAAAVESAEGSATRPQPHFQDFPALDQSRMINDNRAFVEEHRVRGYEVGPDQHTSLHTIANVLQEVASNHAVAMWGRSEEGFASDPSLEEGLIFVMTRLQIQMDEFPRWGDVVQVETWFMPSGKIGAQRDWLIRCSNTGRPLGRATSSWVMINLRTRRLAKVPEAFRQKCMGFVDEQERQAVPPADAKHKIPEVAMPAEIVGPMQLARRSDIDMNGHVNNVTYMAWALETVPQDVYDNCQLMQVEIDFKAECHCGDVIESLAQRSELPEGPAALAASGSGNGNGNGGAGHRLHAFVHTLRRCEGDSCTELVRMRTLWREPEPAPQ